MGKPIFIFLFTSILLNAQLLDVLVKEDHPELNSNASLDFSYTDLLSGWNFTNWVAYSGATIVDNNTFTTASAGGVKKDAFIVNSKILAFNLSGVFTGTSTALTLRSYDSNTLYWTSSAAGAFSVSFIALSVGTGLYWRHGNAGTVDITMSVYELKAPNDFITPTMTATDYVIEDSGCKFVEVTGETKITMSDTLAAGYYKLKPIQNWTQGKLWAYNGTTTYNFPQSDGEYTVKIYLPGNKPLVIGCDNNTISVLSSLSIK